MSIRTRLLLIALVATALPALLIGGRFVQERSTAVAAAAHELPEIAQRIASDLDEKIQGTEQLHFGLARAPDLDTHDRAACSDFLSQVREEYPQYTGILTITPDGHLFCDSLNTGRELDLNDRVYFRRAVTLYDEIALQPAFGRLTGIAVLQIAYPVRSPTGQLRSVLLASLNLAQFSRAQSVRELDRDSHRTNPAIVRYPSQRSQPSDARRFPDPRGAAGNDARHLRRTRCGHHGSEQTGASGPRQRSARPCARLRRKATGPASPTSTRNGRPPGDGVGSRALNAHPLQAGPDIHRQLNRQASGGRGRRPTVGY